MVEYMPKLDVFVSNDCWSCAETREIVTAMQVQFPQMEIALRDSEPELWPQEVFAVPTYMLDGRVISLGNPSRSDLVQRLQAVNNGVVA